MSELGEKINNVIWGVQFHGIEPSDALDQILTAIEGGIEVCNRCGGKGGRYLEGFQWKKDTDGFELCLNCGGKGWVGK